jgi:hypothetical protein
MEIIWTNFEFLKKIHNIKHVKNIYQEQKKRLKLVILMFTLNFNLTANLFMFWKWMMD